MSPPSSPSSSSSPPPSNPPSTEETIPTEETNFVKKARKRKRKKKTADHATSTPTDPSLPPSLPASVADELSRTLYIEGLPYTTNSDSVTSFFSSHSLPPSSLRLPVWQDTGRLRGFGHVVFDSVSARDTALNKLDKLQYPNSTRYVALSKPKPPRAALHTEVGEQPAGCAVVHVRNLPYTATEDSVREAFQVFGKIIDHGVRIPRNANGQVKGFGYVTFKNPEGASGAVNKAAKPYGMTVGGRPVICSYDEGSIRGSFKMEDGRKYAKVKDGGKNVRKNGGGPKL